MCGALTIFGCLSRSQGSRYWGKERKGKGAGQQLRSGPGSSASSREPSLTSSAVIVPLKALKLWLPSQEISRPGRAPVSNRATANLAGGWLKAELCLLLLSAPSFSSRHSVICLRLDAEQAGGEELEVLVAPLP